MKYSQKTFSVRLANIEDLAGIIELDASITNINKSTYWTKMFERFQNSDGRYFLVVEDTKNGAHSNSL
ncbi:MAG: hypothetical protein VX617_03955 [Pseudomonadota bacterium]|nr:hypothetical protein [Pseudomonadota bacterium]